MKTLISAIGMFALAALTPVNAQELQKIGIGSVPHLPPEYFEGFYSGTVGGVNGYMANYDLNRDGKTDTKLFYPVKDLRSTSPLVVKVGRPTVYWRDRNGNAEIDKGEAFEIEYPSGWGK